MADILEVIKKASKQVEEQSSPSNVLFGVVISINPLQIQVEQKLILTKEFLILTKNVIDYTVNVSLDWNINRENLNANHSHIVKGGTEVSIQNANIDLTHNHTISGTKSIIIHNALKQNDKVILLQQRGGQRFVVLDKIY